MIPTDLHLQTYGSSSNPLHSRGGCVTSRWTTSSRNTARTSRSTTPAFNAWRNRSDNKVHCLGYWYFNKVVPFGLNYQVNTLQMRYDVLKELGYAKLAREKEGGRIW